MTIKNGKRGCMYGKVGGVLLGFFSALVNDKGPPMNPFAFGLNWDGIIINERTKSYKSMKFQQKPHKKTKDKKSFIEKLREEEQKKMDRLIKTNDKENEDGNLEEK